MVKVPTRDEPQLEIKPQTIDPSSAATLGGEVVDLAKGIGAIGEHIQKMQDESQTNKAQADLLNRFSAIHTQFASDPDLTTAPIRAQEEMTKAVTESSNLITSSRARNEFQGKAAIEKARKSSEMNSMFVSKSIKEAKYNMFNNVDSIIKQAWGSSNPGHIDQAKKQINDVVSKAVATGYVAPEAAKYYLDDHIGKLIEGQVDHDMNLPGMAQRANDELKKGDKGIYPDLKPSVREKKIKDSERLVKRQLNEQKDALKNYQSDNGNYLVQLSKTKQLTPEVIQEFGYTGRISRKEFKSWMNKIHSDIIHGDTDPETYNDAIPYMTNPKNSIDDVREYLLDKYSKNKLSTEDFHNLYEMHLKPISGGNFQSVRNAYGKEKEMQDAMVRHKNFMQSANDIINDYVKSKIPFYYSFDKTSKEEKDHNDKKQKQMLSSWAEKVSKNISDEQYPKIANDVVKLQRLIDNPEIATYPDDGQTVQDEDGHRAIISNEGDESVDESTVQTNSEDDNGITGF